MMVCIFGLSFIGAGLSFVFIATDPALNAVRAATMDEIVAATDRLLAETATPELLANKIEGRLTERPRNWIALDALTELAIDRALDLPPDLALRVSAAREEDFSLLSQAASCAICTYDAGQCSLSQVFICQAPVALTPVGDVLGVSRAGAAYARGEAIDQVDLALSVVGLGATAAVLVSGGSSGAIKAGASTLKVARQMGRLSPDLVDMAYTAAKTGVSWDRLGDVRSLADLSATLRPQALGPLTQTIIDLDRVRTATDTTTALHLLPLVGSASDARKLATLAEALGPKVVARAEILGKVRILRTTVRLTSLGWSVMLSLAGLALSLVGLASALGKSLALRHLSRAA